MSRSGLLMADDDEGDYKRAPHLCSVDATFVHGSLPSISPTESIIRCAWLVILTLLVAIAAGRGGCTHPLPAI